MKIPEGNTILIKNNIIMEQQIYTTLKGLKMPGLAECLRAMDETRQLDKLSVREALPILIQAEVSNREGNRIKTLIKQANFRISATIEELDIDAVRGVPSDTILQLSTSEYIKNGATIIISGAAGTGKTYLNNAIGNKACRLGFKVGYYTMNKLMDMIRIVRIEGKDHRFMTKLEKLDLIIIDDFGMKTLDNQQQNDFQQILDDRYDRKAIVISSQLPISEWHSLFKNELIADACLDRMVHKSIRFQLKGDSLRKKY